MKHFLKTTAFGCALLALCTGQTQTAFAQTISDEYIAVSDGYTVEEVVEQKLGKGDYSYENLSSFSDPDRFILVEGDNCYLIYDNQLKDFLEFSTECNSIYYDLDKSTEKIYFAPTYYFFKSQKNVYDMYNNNSVLSKAEINNYISSEPMLLNSYRQDKEKETQKNEPLSSSEISVHIPEWYYFENLDTNFGNNTTGSCGYVALGMLLSYYDSVKNDNVIPENYDVTSTQTFIDYESIWVSAFTSSPGTDDVFHKYLISLGKGLNISDQDDEVTNSYGIFNLMDYYLNYIGIEHTCSVAGSFVNKSDYCKQIINNGDPVIISIKGTDISVDPDKMEHAVVGYGYDSKGIYAHFGWDNTIRDYKKIYISNYTIKNACNVNMNAEEHVCSDNYRWNVNGASGTVCTCGLVTCFHEGKAIYFYDDIYHERKCSVCGGDSTLIPHSFVTNGEYKTCSVCWHKVHIHKNYTYSPIIGGKFHWARCGCGYKVKETCFGVTSAFESEIRCTKCGQKISSSMLGINDEDLEQIIVLSAK